MMEHDGKLYGMAAFHDGVRRLRREVIHVRLAAAFGLLLRKAENGRIEPALAQQAGARLEVVPLHILHIAVHQRLFLRKQPGELLLQAALHPGVPAFQAEAGYKEVHLVLVAANQNVDILGCAAGVCRKGVGGQVLSVPLRELVQEKHRRSGFQQLLAVHLQEIGHRPAAQGIHQLLRARDGLFRGTGQVHGTALGNEPMEVLLGTRNQGQQGAAASSGGFTPDGHVVRVPAKGCNVLVHPLERLHLVQQAQVLGIRILGAVRQMAQVQETHDAQAVRNGNHDDVRILLHKIVAVKHRVDGSTGLEAAAMNPDHDRFLPGGIVLLEHIQIQAVLVHIVQGTRFHLSVSKGALGIVKGLIHTVAGRHIHRGLPAQLANRLLSYIRDAPVGNDVFFLPAHKRAVDALDSKRFVIISVGDGMVLPAIHGFQGLSDFS